MAQRLAQHLISRGLLPAKVVDEALRKLSAGSGSLDTALLEMGAISEAGMLQALSDVSGMRLVNLADFEPNAEAGPMLPLKISRRLTVVPLSVDGNVLHLACGYPVPHKELREVAFLLGKELELWVALECRVRDWQTALYREPMPDRFRALLRQLDPGRRGLTPAQPAPAAPVPSTKSSSARPTEKVVPPPPKKKPELIPVSGQTMTEPGGALFTESLSMDALEKIARGVIAEPVLLVKPKAKKPSPPISGPNDGRAAAAKPSHVMDVHQTVVVEPEAYQAAYVMPKKATDEVQETTVLDTTGYANFAKQMVNVPEKKPRVPGDRTTTEPEMPAIMLQPPSVAPVSAPPAKGPPPLPTGVAKSSVPRITAQKVDEDWKGTDLKFPGGVLPPRNRHQEELGPTHREVRAVERSWVTPAASARPSIERIKSQTGSMYPQAAPVVPAPIPPPPELMPEVTLPQAPLAEDDFSDVRPELTPPPSRRPVLSPAPVQRAGAAAPVEPPRPSVPPVGYAVAPLMPEIEVPPELQPSHGQAPAMASAAPSGPPELAASGPSFPAPIVIDEPPPSAPLARRMPANSAAIVVPTGSPTEWTLAQARAALKISSQERDKLVSVALDYGRRAFEFVGAFAVMRGAAVGWDARGEGDASVIRQISIPLDAASVFRTVALTRGSYVGPLPPDALTQHYLSLLGRSPRAVFLWPVEVKARLVAMIYGDSGSKPVSQRKLNDFILFCQELPSAFGELIVLRKQRHGTSGPFNETAPEPAQVADPTMPATEADFAQADADWFSGLLTLLTGPDARERANAMTELSRTPDSSARALVRAFPGPTAWSRLPVTELPEVDELGPIPGALARLGRAGAVALAPLLDADDSDTRYLALLTAGALKYPELLDGVLRGLFDMEPDISSAARAAATAMKWVDGFPEAIRRLRQELASRDPLRKSLAARALGMLHDRDAIEGLIGLTASEDQLCSQSAAEALREITRTNLGPNPRQWAAWYANARSQRRVDWLCEALSNDDFELRLAAVEELSRAWGDNLGYFADAPQEERAVAVETWRAAIGARGDFDL
jgi:hypothetical protein